MSRSRRVLRPIGETCRSGTGVRSPDVRYLLIIHMDPEIWESLSQQDRRAVHAGHDEFQRAVWDSGEMLGTSALADPSNSAVVRVRAGVPAVTEGPYLRTREYLAGYYLVDCESRERAIELAGQIPDARMEGLGIEVRPVMFSSGMEM
jgi:hypothetical protein